jgi:type III secretion system YscD/HrpQ family protein
MSEPRKQWLLKVIAGPHQGAEISLDEGKALVGSDDACDVVLHDIMIAPQHLELEFARNGTSAAPLGGRVFLNGKRVKDARQTVPDFAFISIGGSHLVVGPQDGKWPLLSPADVPELEKDAPEPPKTEEASATTPVAPSEIKALEVLPTPARRRAAWVGVICGCFILVAWLIGWHYFVRDYSKDKLPPTRPVEIARAALKELGVAERIKLEESAGKVNATGYVNTDAKQREVQAMLRECVPGILIRVWSLEKVVGSARSLLAAQKVPLLVSSLQDGEVKVSGMMATPEEWERVRQLLMSEIPGLSGIDDQVRINPVKAQAVPVAVRQAAPQLTAAVAALPVPVQPAAPVIEVSDATVLTITSNSDGLGWMRTNTGNVYFMGAQLPVGGIVTAITKDGVSVLDNGKKRELRRGERLGGDQGLQTIASPTQLPTGPIP